MQAEDYIKRLMLIASGRYRGKPHLVTGRAFRMWRIEDPRLSLEVEFDDRAEVLNVLLVRMHCGRIPDGYYVDSFGNKCRIHLNAALKSLQLPTKQYGRLDLNGQCNYLASALDILLKHLDFNQSHMLFQ